jgi:hypothetical protein
MMVLGVLKQWLLRIFPGLGRERYRPELHYMRGPGPKFRERAGQR